MTEYLVLMRFTVLAEIGKGVKEVSFPHTFEAIVEANDEESAKASAKDRVIAKFIELDKRKELKVKDNFKKSELNTIEFRVYRVRKVKDEAYGKFAFKYLHLIPKGTEGSTYTFIEDYEIDLVVPIFEEMRLEDAEKKAWDIVAKEYPVRLELKLVGKEAYLILDE